MTDSEFLRAFLIGLGTGFLLGIVVAGYAALGVRGRRGEEVTAPRLRVADNTVRRLYGAGRRKRHLN